MKDELHPTKNRFSGFLQMDDRVNELIYFLVWPLGRGGGGKMQRMLFDVGSDEAGSQGSQNQHSSGLLGVAVRVLWRGARATSGGCLCSLTRSCVLWRLNLRLGTHGGGRSVASYRLHCVRMYTRLLTFLGSHFCFSADHYLILRRWRNAQPFHDVFDGPRCMGLLRS